MFVVSFSWQLKWWQRFRCEQVHKISYKSVILVPVALFVDNVFNFGRKLFEFFAD